MFSCFAGVVDGFLVLEDVGELDDAVGQFELVVVDEAVAVDVSAEEAVGA